MRHRPSNMLEEAWIQLAGLSCGRGPTFWCLDHGWNFDCFQSSPVSVNANHHCLPSLLNGQPCSVLIQLSILLHFLVYYQAAENQQYNPFTGHTGLKHHTFLFVSFTSYLSQSSHNTSIHHLHDSLTPTRLPCTQQLLFLTLSNASIGFQASFTTPNSLYLFPKHILHKTTCTPE